MKSARSRTRSGTTSSRASRRKPRPDSAFAFPGFYADESATQTILPNALRARGFHVETRRSVFPTDPLVTDPVWLDRCGREGWVAITKDKAIWRRPGELRILKLSKVPMFVISAGSLTGTEQAELVCEAIPSIRRIVKSTPPPFIVRILAGARVEFVDI